VIERKQELKARARVRRNVEPVHGPECRKDIPEMLAVGAGGGTSAIR
jgi:hypothetical protein